MVSTTRNNSDFEWNPIILVKAKRVCTPHNPHSSVFNSSKTPAICNLGEYYQMLQIQSSAPDDGRRHRLKHVELTGNNKLTYKVASCWLLSQETSLFNIQVQLRLAVILPVAFVYSCLFRARLNASHKEIRTHGKGGKEEVTKGDVWKEEGESNRNFMIKSLMICTHNQVLFN
jgi:hypothetical protein